MVGILGELREQSKAKLEYHKNRLREHYALAKELGLPPALCSMVASRPKKVIKEAAQEYKAEQEGKDKDSR